MECGEQVGEEIRTCPINRWKEGTVALGSKDLPERILFISVETQPFFFLNKTKGYLIFKGQQNKIIFDHLTWPSNGFLP